jgi:hypothetical protein
MVSGCTRALHLKSLRFKEGRILRDTLNTVESRRFHIAAYLFFHYQTVWNAFQEYALEISDSDSQSSSDEVEAHEDAMQDAKTTDACDGFLASLSTDELLWIQEFSDFLLDDIDRMLNLKNDPTYFVRMGFTARNAANLSLGRQQFSCFNPISSCELDSWRYFFLSTSVEFFGNWQNVFMDTARTPTYLQRKELWLADAVSRILQARGFSKTKEKILTSKGILIPTCEYPTFGSASFGYININCMSGQKCGQQPEKRLLFNKTSKTPVPAPAPSTDFHLIFRS